MAGGGWRGVGESTSGEFRADIRDDTTCRGEERHRNLSFLVRNHGRHASYIHVWYTPPPTLFLKVTMLDDDHRVKSLVYTRPSTRPST